MRTVDKKKGVIHIKIADPQIRSEVIRRAVDALINLGGAVYSDDVAEKSCFSREVVGRWLRANGFEKTGGCTSKRWVNPNYKKRNHHAPAT